MGLENRLLDCNEDKTCCKQMKPVSVKLYTIFCMFARQESPAFFHSSSYVVVVSIYCIHIATIFLGNDLIPHRCPRSLDLLLSRWTSHGSLPMPWKPWKGEAEPGAGPCFFSEGHKCGEKDQFKIRAVFTEFRKQLCSCFGFVFFVCFWSKKGHFMLCY